MHINLTYARTLPLVTWLGAFYYAAGKAAKRAYNNYAAAWLKNNHLVMV